MTLGKIRLPSARTPHARKAVAVSVACLVLAAIGCERTRSTTGSTEKWTAFCPTKVIDPKEPIDSKAVPTSPTTTPSTTNQQVNP